MAKQGKTNSEKTFSAETEAMFHLLTRSGMIPNGKIKDKAIREQQQMKLRRAYHNTELMLKQYRTIVWMVECFPETLSQELDEPFEEVDRLIDKLEVEMTFGNRRLENKLEGIRQTRLILDRINDALDVLKRKPDGGALLYELIYLTYIIPEKLSHVEIIFRLNLSSRQYYRLREQAFTILSLRLWAAPKREVDFWLEMLSVLNREPTLKND